jgi:branched-chain amino acid transport system ATP-binding protein
VTATLSTTSLSKRYGALLVTDAVCLDLAPGSLHAVIGPNGAGKTTLVNLLSGELPPDQGKVHFDGEDITGLRVHARARRGLVRSYQVTSIFEELSVFENVALAALGSRGHAWKFWHPLSAEGDARLTAKEVLSAVGLGMSAETAAGDMAYGERRQLEMAMALAAQPRLLLLDEPLAGMSGPESAVITGLLRSLKGRYTILLVEHDMDAVFALADRISVLVYGRILFTGTPDEVRAHPEVKAVYLGEGSG